MDTRISVIMPVYNAEQTLREAVRSVLMQEMEGLELLLVDDGSTDATASVCHELSQQDARIRVIFQKNAGICAARNRGLSAAAGEYFTFCDDDDLLLPGALRALYETAEACQADVVRGDYQLMREAPDGSFYEQRHPAGVRCELAQDGYEVFLRNSGPQFVWNALYRRSSLETIRFDERCRYGLEDFLFNMAVYAATDRAIYLPQLVYRHFESTQSTSRCQSAQALRGRIRVVPLWLDAEYASLRLHSEGTAQKRIWNVRKAEAVTFLMHQLRDAKAPVVLRRYAWTTLRKALRSYPEKPLDFLYGAAHNRKKTVALLLYQLHLEWIYDLFPDEQSTK